MSKWRFFRRIPIIPGFIYINISKKSISLSIGKCGWVVTFNKHGIRFTIGLTGFGLFVSNYKKWNKQKSKNYKEEKIYDIKQFSGEKNGKKEKR